MYHPLKNTKHQHSDGDYVKDLNEASYNKDKAALSDPVVPTGLPNLMQSAITSDALPTRVVLANMELMETFPVSLIRLFFYHYTKLVIFIDGFVYFHLRAWNNEGNNISRHFHTLIVTSKFFK